MRSIKRIKSLPTGSPASELLKLIGIIAATVLVDKLSSVAAELANDNKIPQRDVKYKEVD